MYLQRSVNRLIMASYLRKSNYFRVKTVLWQDDESIMLLGVYQAIK